MKLKGLAHVTVNKPVIAMISFIFGMCPLFSVHMLLDGVNAEKLYVQKSTNISAFLQHMNVMLLSFLNSKIHPQNNTFILKDI